VKVHEAGEQQHNPVLLLLLLPLTLLRLQLPSHYICSSPNSRSTVHVLSSLPLVKNSVCKYMKPGNSSASLS
jgi:hypothetical protein